ncbi:MAG: hypothetical protein LBG61_05870 [Burkholderiales bacterium]|jgi:hypothetical protein|nr:hypothetical protein [Burkholderiales bacterium]
MAHLQNTMTTFNFKSRFKAFLVHLIFSCVIALFSLWVIFSLWYPGIFADALGGFKLFFLVVGCDVVVGPTLMFVIFNTKKPRAELVRDISIIALFQLIALGYGMHVVAESRPVYAVFVKDQIEVVTAIELDDKSFEGLTEKTEPYKKLPWTGIRYVSINRPESAEERSEVLLSSVFEGRDYPLWLRYYQPYEAATDAIIAAIKPLDEFQRAVDNLPHEKQLFDNAVAATQLPPDRLGWLLVKHRFGFCTALMDKQTGKVATYVLLDAYDLIEKQHGAPVKDEPKEEPQDKPQDKPQP